MIAHEASLLFSRIFRMAPKSQPPRGRIQQTPIRDDMDMQEDFEESQFDVRKVC